MGARLFIASMFVCAILPGCTSHPPPKQSSLDADIDKHIAEAAKRIEAAQSHLYQVGAFSEHEGHDTAQIADGQRVTLAWRGDAEQLLIQLAHRRGMLFFHQGVRVPLPVVIDAQEASMDEILGRVRAQIGYRAVVSQEPTRLTLFYNPPK